MNSFETNGFSIRKSSTREAKLIKEALWFEKAPTSMFSFFPRVKIEKSGSYSMQYVEALSLGEKLLYGNPDLINWQWILGQLSSWFMKAADYQIPTDESLDPAELEKWFKDHFNRRLNGPALGALDESIRRAYLESQQEVQSLIEESCFTLAGNFGNLVHGDLVFSNILVDESRELLKLIDPRGGFHESSIFGPPIYDWAKLAQCIFGRYEELASDQFEIVDIEDSAKIKYANCPLRLRNYEILREWFLSSCPEPLYAVKLAGLLLLTAIDFHQENPRRMNAMVIQGLELIESK